MPYPTTDRWKQANLFSVVVLDLLKMLRKSKTYSPKWWSNCDFPWYKVNNHLKPMQDQLSVLVFHICKGFMPVVSRPDRHSQPSLKSGSSHPSARNPFVNWSIYKDLNEKTVTLTIELNRVWQFEKSVCTVVRGQLRKGLQIFVG